ncbi:MAG: isocitrate lyase/phosphoenolpyruvate mutase family protein, partial [Nitrospinales bacterium]
TVTKLERAGVSAVIIEDKVFPKRNSLEPGTQQTLESPEVFASKIKRGRNIRLTDDFMIIARIESLIAGTGMEDALERAKTYLKAGVDGIMIHSKSKEPDEILQFTKKYHALLKTLNLKIPLVCVPTTYNTITEEQLAAAGFNIVIYANHLLRTSYKSMSEVAKNILLNQRSFEVDPLCAPVRDIFQTVGFLEVKEKDQKEDFNKNIPVIIPAAGEEQVLTSLLNGKPKAMLEIAGKTLLRRQISSLNNNRLTDITVVAGYGKDKLRAEGIAIVENKDYKNGSMIHSIFTAREKMNNGFIMLFSDILLEDSIITQLMTCPQDIVLVIDNSIHYHKQEGNKFADLVISKNKHKRFQREINFVDENLISNIGQKIVPETATHEFIGLAKFTRNGAEQFIQTYEDCIENYSGPFQESDDIASFTFNDLIQEMIDRGFSVHYLEIHKGWLEIHNPKDVEIANNLF